MTDYPAEPWDLHGQLISSVFLVPAADIPMTVPDGCRLVRLGRHAIVGTAWVSYEPTGVLAYSELMSTVVVRQGWRLLPTITHIWVDSPASLAGGRALWGIPKELADFAVNGVDWSAAERNGGIAKSSVRVRGWLPGRLPVGFRVAQMLDGRLKLSPVRSRARIGLAHVQFAAEPEGPLAFLAGRRPLVSFALGDFRMQFGVRRS